jgi:5'-deoxynucleotidase YfbR-like HD superfamily hydrolase
MIIIHKLGRLESLPRQDLPHNSIFSLEAFNLSHAYFFASIGGFLWFFKNKIPATSVRQKTFLQALSSHSYEVAILTNFYKTLTSHKSLI